jgi:hypothetical protein
MTGRFFDRPIVLASDLLRKDKVLSFHKALTGKKIKTSRPRPSFVQLGFGQASKIRLDLFSFDLLDSNHWFCSKLNFSDLAFLGTLNFLLEILS